MFHNRRPTSDNVAKRNGPANGMCAICGLVEDANHVFFGCCLARFACSAVTDWNPQTSDDVLNLLTAQRGGVA